MIPDHWKRDNPRNFGAEVRKSVKKTFEKRALMRSQSNLKDFQIFFHSRPIPSLYLKRFKSSKAPPPAQVELAALFLVAKKKLSDEAGKSKTRPNTRRTVGQEQ